MDSNIDVLKELEVKNKEIYINKLNLDIDNNLENLLISISNVLNLTKEEMFDKISDVISNKEVIINNFISILYNEISRLLNKKSINLKNIINNSDFLKYNEILNNETNSLINNLKDFYQSNVLNLINKLSLNINNSDRQRIEEYLKVFNYERFINKIKDLIINMDVILYNNYLDSNQKYNNLNEKTLNKV